MACTGLNGHNSNQKTLELKCTKECRSRVAQGLKSPCSPRCRPPTPPRSPGCRSPWRSSSRSRAFSLLSDSPRLLGRREVRSGARRRSMDLAQSCVPPPPSPSLQTLLLAGLAWLSLAMDLTDSVGEGPAREPATAQGVPDGDVALPSTPPLGSPPPPLLGHEHKRDGLG